MENWGLITYGQTAMIWEDGKQFLYKDKTAKTVAYVIAHEVAHQVSTTFKH
jgi:aminopeptidase N